MGRLSFKNVRDEGGASAVEYGLLVAAVAALIAAVVFTLGTMTRDSFGDTCGKFRSGTSGTPGATCS
jgi:pilus assembly protein Flp/PilA